MSRYLGDSPLPPIVVGERDYDRLSELAAVAAHRMPEVAESLLFELDRATVVDNDAVPPGNVRLGSRVTYAPDDADARCIALVLPSEADIAAGKVSILTPVGAALLGLSADQEITWVARDGRQHSLRVVAVEQPGPVRV